MDDYQKVADLIREKGYTVGFTGAGISVDSGIPAFRGGQGLWEKYDPMEYAHISAFNSNPEKVWVMLREMSEVIFNSKPSPAHMALNDLEKKGHLKAVIMTKSPARSGRPGRRRPTTIGSMSSTCGPEALHEGPHRRHHHPRRPLADHAGARGCAADGP